MRAKVSLITGAAGEVGQALIQRLSTDYACEQPTAAATPRQILALDLNPLPTALPANVHQVQGSILDTGLLDRLVSEYEIEEIYHLAALLSTRAEFSPDAAHRVNVEGTLALLHLAAQQSEWRNEPVRFIFPSSIAVFGLPDQKTKATAPRVREWEWNYPTTMYGCNKLYCELLGVYFSRHYRQLAADRPTSLDFRAVRFPGLVSAFTIPSGGTSDYGPEMLHAAAQRKPYACFVREDVRIPFMAMPDAVKALIDLARAPQEALSRPVYNVTSFSLSAAEFRDHVLRHFPDAQIGFAPDLKRQQIVETWPADLDDSTARRDWAWHPDYDVDRAFAEYLVPNIRRRYEVGVPVPTGDNCA
ncbi:MAG: NAD-dependent epimerase/dehydratase family protein [Anaerolineae bacterium]|nr:NAD-dependent epimerase/dehydratase family protein [Anaerolineae bacterium]